VFSVVRAEIVFPAADRGLAKRSATAARDPFDSADRIGRRAILREMARTHAFWLSF
jgi:hypothetical protein